MDKLGDTESGKARPPEHAGGDVEADVGREAPVGPRRELAARLVDHPVADLLNQRGVFDKGQERVRQQQAPIRIAPAQQAPEATPSAMSRTGW
jgi:hypothetical protein